MPTATMNNEVQEFAWAAQNNEYCTYTLEDNFILVTNSTSDGEFRPWVVLPNQFTDEDGVLTNLVDEEVGELLSFESLEINEQEKYFNYAVLKSPEITV